MCKVNLHIAKKGYGENTVCPIMKTNAKRRFVFIRPLQEPSENAHTTIGLPQSVSFVGKRRGKVADGVFAVRQNGVMRTLTRRGV